MLTASGTRYLLAIYELSEGGKPVRSVDIATSLKVTRASVVKMLKLLSSGGFIIKPHYGDVLLTELGRRHAEGIYKQYRLLQVFFEKNLLVKADCAKSDALTCLCALSDQGKDWLINMVTAHS